MILDNCTQEFKKIYNRYRKETNIVKKTENLNTNIQKVLEERSKQMIDKQDEEDLLYEEAMNGMLKQVEGGASDDKAIHLRIKLEKINKKKKKFHKKNLLKMLENDNFEIDGINEFSVEDSPGDKRLSTEPFDISPKISAKKLLNLPKLKVMDKRYEKIAKIKELINGFPKIKKAIEKVCNVNDSFKANSNYINLIASNRGKDISTVNSLIFPTTDCSVHRSSRNHLSISNMNMNKLFDNELDKTLNQIVGSNDTEKVLKVIEKQNKLNDYMQKIQNFENKILKTRENTLSKLDNYEKRKFQLQNKFRRVLDKNF
jgi:hypothetical protein